MSIRKKLLEHFPSAIDAAEVAENTWNVYFPPSLARPTQTVWIYNEIVEDDDDKTYEFSIDNRTHVYRAVKL